MECYLDNAATTKPSEAVIKAVNEAMSGVYGNPSSLHKKGFEAERLIEEAREKIAKTVRASANEIIFTSGGTESNNHAILEGVELRKRHGRHIITTSVEHSSVKRPVEYLKKEGCEVSYLSADRLGQIKNEDLLKLLREDTVLLSVMLVNNEIGSINDVESLIKTARSKNPNILVHIDAVQGYGKLNINTKKLGADFLSVSAHKIHGPKGIGCLYIRNGLKLPPYILGGGQQKNFRSGTENVYGIAGFAAAAEEIYKNYEKRTEKFYFLKEKFIRGIIKEFPEAVINGVDLEGNLSENIRRTAPHIVNVSFKGIRSEVLLHALEEKGIYVSAGSACASNGKKEAGTLEAIGATVEEAESSVRFSFGSFTETEMIDYTLKELKEIVPELLKYRRR